MAGMHRTLSCGLVALACGVAFAQSPTRAPRIWSDRDLADWATPIAALNLRPAHLDPQYQPKGWNPPGLTTRALPGHTFGLSLAPDDKGALLAFLRTL